MPPKKKESLSVYRNIAMSFAGLTVLLILTMVYFSVVRATVTVTPKVLTIPLQATVDVVSAPDAANTRDTIRGEVVSMEVSKEEAFATTLTDTTVGKATGTVRIVSTHTADQTLVASTRLLAANGILYRLAKRVVVPKNSSVTATITADKEGKDQEVAATRWTIPGLSTTLQAKIYGITDTPTSGTTQVYKVTKESIDAARASMITNIKREVEAGREATHLVSLEVTPLETEVSEAVGANVRTFTISMKARVRGVVVPREAITAWATERLESALPDDRRLLTLKTENVTASLETLREADGVAVLRVSVTGETVTRSTSPIFDRQRMVGRQPAAVKALLLQDQGIADVDVRMTPPFMKRMPRLPDHINIKIQNPNL